VTRSKIIVPLVSITNYTKVNTGLEKSSLVKNLKAIKIFGTFRIIFQAKANFEIFF
jgi:hypothetical protein